MISLASWNQRPVEEANLFNPAFCGALSYEFVRDFEKAKDTGAPYPLLPVALTLSLHPNTRRKLPTTTVTSLYDWAQKNPECLVGLAERVQSVLPYVREGISFAVSYGALRFTEGFDIHQGTKKCSFTPTFLEQSTQEINETVKVTRFIARWFAKSGSTSSILACWGIRP